MASSKPSTDFYYYNSNSRKYDTIPSQATVTELVTVDPSQVQAHIQLEAGRHGMLRLDSEWGSVYTY